jgi:hypothetical protein
LVNTGTATVSLTAAGNIYATHSLLAQTAITLVSDGTKLIRL